ncbi:hypothetical protein [Gayadomonas joobiniege]|uniref:hypothetical protein n=1 Tax=Gayadomonas joobiniege TaxID=1234606 RepID=UPI000364CFF3|nr:hypothetical protein [Gayadomonas joobiniege]
MRVLFGLFKTLFILFTVAVIAAAAVFYFSLQNTAHITTDPQVSAERADNAGRSLSELARKLNNSTGLVHLTFSQTQLDEITEVLSYALTSSQFKADISAERLSLKMSHQLNVPIDRNYLNVECLFSEKAKPIPIKLEQCSAGDINLPTWAIELLFRAGLYKVFNKELALDIQHLVQEFAVNKQTLAVSLNIKKGMREQVLAALQQASGRYSDLFNPMQVAVEPDVVKTYLQHIKQLKADNPEQQSLVFFLNRVFSFAALRSTPETAAGENHAALWALTIAFGNHKFGHFIGLPRSLVRSFNNINTQLAGRQDLSKHFLYSILLQRLLDEKMGLKIGELKEIIDSDEGGSGFSFVDLMADKAGLKFAMFVLDKPIKAQQKLAAQITEADIFPSISGLQEGFSEAEFKRLFGSSQDPRYQQVEQKIDQRIDKLPLYQSL